MVEKTEIFACSSIDKVMLMSDFTHNNWLADQRFNLEPASGLGLSLSKGIRI